MSATVAAALKKIAVAVLTDKKLRQRIREKKMAMGHKADDHEDEGIKMQ